MQGLHVAPAADEVAADLGDVGSAAEWGGRAAHAHDRHHDHVAVARAQYRLRLGLRLGHRLQPPRLRIGLGLRLGLGLWKDLHHHVLAGKVAIIARDIAHPERGQAPCQLGAQRGGVLQLIVGKVQPLNLPPGVAEGGCCACGAGVLARYELSQDVVVSVELEQVGAVGDGGRQLLHSVVVDVQHLCSTPQAR